MTLREAVKKQLKPETEEEFKETLQDVAEHGADSGFSGFIYYSETVPFHDKYEKEIWDAVYDDALGMGQTPLEMIADFAGARHVTDMDELKNLLVWYVLERVASEEE